MQTLFVNIFLLISFGQTLIRGEQTNVRTKHLFVQRKGPLRGSSLPHREIYLPEDGNGSAERSLKDSKSRRSKRSTRERRSTNRDPTDTMVSYMFQLYLIKKHLRPFVSGHAVYNLCHELHEQGNLTYHISESVLLIR